MSSAIAAAGQLFYAQLAVGDPQKKVNVQAIAVGATESGTLAFVSMSLYQVREAPCLAGMVCSHCVLSDGCAGSPVPQGPGAWRGSKETACPPARGRGPACWDLRRRLVPLSPLVEVLFTRRPRRLSQTTGSTEASPQAHSTALVPVVPAGTPPPAPRNGIEPRAAPRRPPELAPEPELQPKTFADSARSLFKNHLSGRFLATVRAKIFATLIGVFVPQLVTKLLLRCVNHALINSSTEAVGTLVQATE